MKGIGAGVGEKTEAASTPNLTEKNPVPVNYWIRVFDPVTGAPYKASQQVVTKASLVPAALAIDTNAVAIDMANLMQANFKLLADADFELSFTNLVEGAVGIILIKKTIAGNVVVTLPTGSWMSTDVTGWDSGTSTLTITGANNSFHEIAFKYGLDPADDETDNFSFKYYGASA